MYLLPLGFCSSVALDDFDLRSFSPYLDIFSEEYFWTSNATRSIKVLFSKIIIFALLKEIPIHLKSDQNFKLSLS